MSTTLTVTERTHPLATLTTKTLVSRNEQRTVIAKLRQTAEIHPGLTVEHQRIRKTKAHPFEVNTYTLTDGVTAWVTVETGLIGIARWANNLAAALATVRGNR